ncbi:Hypothetical protein CINCED_3A023637 [Cinara cedri]|uniref:Uncharacterized protein n=1 Tax=Cinara cedri TaxID=506608 RepID=A0A5E4N233_9HEMI|nr:Hypothetical protein CINCED_3A023637 [Cinara cedri]
MKIHFKKCQNTQSKWTCNESKIKWNQKLDIYDSNKEKVKLESLATLVQYMSDKFELLNFTVSKILNKMKQIREQNKILYVKNEKLSTEAQILHLKINDLDHTTLDKAVEIISIPISSNEDGKTIVEEISHKLNIKCDVKKAYQLSTHQNTGIKLIAWLTIMETSKERIIRNKQEK